MSTMNTPTAPLDADRVRGREHLAGLFELLGVKPAEDDADRLLVERRGVQEWREEFGGFAAPVGGDL